MLFWGCRKTMKEGKTVYYRRTLEEDPVRGGPLHYSKMTKELDWKQNEVFCRCKTRRDLEK